MSKIQDSDVKNQTEAGAASRLINDTKIYVTANSINKRLDVAITDGDIGGGGGGGAAFNLLQNADFRFFQRQTPGTETARQDGTYGPDRWFVLISGGTGGVGCSRDSAASPTGSPSQYNALFTQLDATARRFGAAQWLEYGRVHARRGKQVTFSFWALTSGTEITTIRAGVVEWTGTQDSPTRDFVSSWAATPTLVANAAFVNTPADLTVNNTFQQYTITVTLGSSFNNLGVFIWTPNTEAQNDSIFITQPQLVDGPTAADWEAVSLPYELDLEECQRFYEKSYNLDTPPGTVTTDGSKSGSFANATTSVITNVGFFTRKRTAPSVVFYSNQTGAQDYMVDASTAGDVTIEGYAGPSETGLYYVYDTINAPYVTNRLYIIQYTADCEF